MRSKHANGKERNKPKRIKRKYECKGGGFKPPQA
jgi:hypothetical protein